MAVVFKLCAWTELFSEKNVSVSIDVMRRNTDTKISKLKASASGWCTLHSADFFTSSADLIRG